MPTILSHPAVPAAMRLIMGKENVPRTMLVFGVVASIVPDVDVLGLRFGIPYAHLFGHRGFFHSVTFAFLLASLGVLFYRKSYVRPFVTFIFLFLSTASHGLLDALTNGGLGIAFLSPFSNQRYFFNWQPISVSPLSPERIFSSRIATVLMSEIKWVWTPFLSVGIFWGIVRKIMAKKSVKPTRLHDGRAA